jgi:hypothetical protein
VSDVNDDQTGADLIPPPLGSSQGLSFDQWWEQSGSVYAAAVEAAGGQCWTRDLEERRALFERRYTRPAPPANLKPIESIKSYQKNNLVEIEVPSGQTPRGPRERPMAVSQPIAENVLYDISA